MKTIKSTLAMLDTPTSAGTATVAQESIYRVDPRQIKAARVLNVRRHLPAHLANVAAIAQTLSKTAPKIINY